MTASELDSLARQMLGEASKLEAAGPGAARIARRHLERMVEAARSAGMGGNLPTAALAKLRRQLRAIAGDCAWDLGGLGNRKSWAFDRVVTALQSANRVASPLLEASGLNAAELRPDPDALAHAFQRLDTAFKDSSASMARAVEKQLVGMVTGGREPEQIARELLAKNVIDPVGNMTPEARAECIARTETMRVYRQAVKQKAAVARLTHFRCVGPVTDRTSPLCRSFVGRTLSESEWQTILGERWDGEHAGRGFHPNCRHSFQPVMPRWVGVAEGDPRRTFGENSPVIQEHDADNSLPTFSKAEFLALPPAERAKIMASSSNGIRLVDDRAAAARGAPPPASGPEVGVKPAAERRAPVSAAPSEKPSAPAPAPRTTQADIEREAAKPENQLQLRGPSGVARPEPEPKAAHVPPSAAAQEAAQSFGRKIAANKYESCAIFDDEGSAVYVKRGGRSQVSFTARECELIRGRTTVHNHNSDISFSMDDVKMMVAYDERQSRVVGPKWTYTMQVSEKTAQRFAGANEEAVLRAKGEFLQAVEADRKAIDKQFVERFSPKVRSGELTPRQATQEHFHQTWEILAQKHGLVYQREATNG